MNAHVIFLGTGSALPARGAANCAYLIQAAGATILIDCGPAILQQLAAVGVSPGAITHVFITHRHGDHLLGYPMLALWWALELPEDGPYPTIYASAITFASLDGLIEHSYGDDFIKERATRFGRVWLAGDSDGEARLNEAITLRTFPMEHSAWAPVLGGRFEICLANAGVAAGARKIVLAFTGDTAPTEAVVRLAEAADLLVHDAAYSATLTPEFKSGGHGHSSAEAAGDHAQRAGARHLALVHLEGENIDADRESAYLAEAARVFDGTVSVPKAGQTLEF